MLGESSKSTSYSTSLGSIGSSQPSQGRSEPNPPHVLTGACLGRRPADTLAWICSTVLSMRRPLGSRAEIERAEDNNGMGLFQVRRPFLRQGAANHPRGRDRPLVIAPSGSYFTFTRSNSQAAKHRWRMWYLSKSEVPPSWANSISTLAHLWSQAFRRLRTELRYQGRPTCDQDDERATCCSAPPRGLVHGGGL